MNYICHGCGTYEVKLWRGYQTLPVELYCADCLFKKNGEPLNTDQRCWEQGWWVRACPDCVDIGYWGLSSTPLHWILWWKALPWKKVEMYAYFRYWDRDQWWHRHTHETSEVKDADSFSYQSLLRQ